jgi:3D (Asp-Asp-Asp) domain-containing protein
MPEAEAPEPVSETYEENTRDFVLTAYTADCAGCSGITYAGLDVRDTITHEGKRIVASDNDALPIGTVLRITFASGRTIDAIVLDRGGAIDNRELDLLVKTRDKALRIGRQDVKVTVLAKWNYVNQTGVDYEMTTNDLRNGSLKAHVNKSEGTIRLIFGRDEYEMTVEGKNGIEAKRHARKNGYDLSKATPFDHMKPDAVADELARLSAEIMAVYDGATRQNSFFMYDAATRKKADEVAWRIYDVKVHGI